jgi:YegS/Rv2252/BmrU family lipid kinase
MSGAEYCFIVNPAAGGGLAGRNWPALHEKLLTAGIEHCHYQSEYSGHCRELALHAFESGQRNFVVVGGDGTANEVLNGLFPACETGSADVALGVVPWGTGNDWARYYGFSPEPDSCVNRLQSGVCSRQDIGRVRFADEAGISRSHYFLNCAGTGIDSYLLREMRTASGHRFRYLFYVLKSLFNFRSSSVQLSMDKESYDGPALLLEVCLGKYAGAGMHFAPDAAVDDGMFDVLLVNKLGIIQLLSSLSYLYNDNINKHWAVRGWQCRFASIATQGAQQFHCDGELVGSLPVEMEVLPGALRVMTFPQPASDRA